MNLILYETEVGFRSTEFDLMGIQLSTEFWLNCGFLANNPKSNCIDGQPILFFAKNLQMALTP